MYSEKVLEHFKNPRNVGKLADADGIGEVGNPVCGDMLTITIKVKNEYIEDVRFQTFGCGAAIAVSSMITEMAKGQKLQDAMKITNKSVAHELGGLPKNNLHCSKLGADALHQAIMDYYRKKNGRKVSEKIVRMEHLGHHEEICTCPFCDHEVKSTSPLCSNCGKTLDKTHY